ncbi:MAG TPA: hypothetical protein VNB86_07470 [Gaiellaceae bacterium]|jgi:hypothetical protein|nr:hypothetical protein [Gaiellaceae bacterium]
MADRATSNPRVPAVPRDMYLPETGPARTKVDRPEHVLPLPSELYLRREAGPKKTDKK